MPLAMVIETGCVQGEWRGSGLKRERNQPMEKQQLEQEEKDLRPLYLGAQSTPHRIL
jgi:hypothetical protein